MPTAATTPALPRRGPAPAFRFILLLGLLDAFGPLGIDMYLPAFPRIERDMHAPGGAMQLTLALFLAGLAVGQLVCGPISDGSGGGLRCSGGRRRSRWRRRRARSRTRSRR